jgi:hypothetical protein
MNICLWRLIFAEILQSTNAQTEFKKLQTSCTQTPSSAPSSREPHPGRNSTQAIWEEQESFKPRQDAI